VRAPSIAAHRILPALQIRAHAPTTREVTATTQDASWAEGVPEEAVAHLPLVCGPLLQGLPGSWVIVFDSALRLRCAEGGSPALQAAAATGQALPDVLPEPVWRQVAEACRAVLDGASRSFPLRTSTGAALRVTLLPVRDREGRVTSGLAISRDETARRDALAELERRLAQQAAVARLGEVALRRTALPELMDAACEVVADTLGVPLASIFEHLGEGRMVVRAARGWRRLAVGTRFEMASYRDAEGRERYASGAVVIRDLPNEPQWRARVLRAEGIVASATVIVGDREAPLGLLGAHAREPREFSAHDLDFLHAVAHVVGEAVEHRRVADRIRHGALHDELTGLPNRTLLADRLTRALARGARTGSHVAVLCVDLDHLKRINDSLGHRAGDELLRAVGPRLQEVLRPGDTVARFAGDGFTVVCEAVTTPDHAAALARRVLEAFEAPFEVAGGTRSVSASIGVVLARPGSGQDPDELIADSEAAMYRAKERGRRRHEFFDATLRGRMRERLELEEDLRRALAEGAGELWVAYQPIHRLADGRMTGVEALARWDHPRRGPVPPAEFVPVAESSGLIVELGRHVLSTACAQVARWQADTPADALALNVNLSARQIPDPGVAGEVARVLAASGLAPASLSLEITEGVLLEDSDETARALAALRDLGLRVVLDDFGTGFSSLGYLRRYALDGLKIDRAFVADLGADGAGDAAIVAAIQGMARALGMRTVAEGVETAAQLERLRGLGCDAAQGYHLGRPAAAAALERQLRGGRVRA
jgi:diguanylate cyclase (GGDEF)-like protein